MPSGGIIMAVMRGSSVREEEMDVRFNFVPGQVVTGVVTRLEEYGAIVDLGVTPGLIENSHASWDGRPANEILRKGQELKSVVLRFDEPAMELCLSLKDMYPDPLLEFSREFLGCVVLGEVERVEKIGTFFALGKGMSGLLLSESGRFQLGSKVHVKVEMVNLFKRQILLQLPDAP